MNQEEIRYEKWRSGIKKDRKGRWKRVDTSVMVFGDDPVQNRIEERLEQNQQILSSLGRGILAFFRRRRLKKEREDLTAEFYRRASELKRSGFQRG